MYHYKYKVQQRKREVLMQLKGKRERRGEEGLR